MLKLSKARKNPIKSLLASLIFLLLGLLFLSRPDKLPTRTGIGYYPLLFGIIIGWAAIALGIVGLTFFIATFIQSRRK